jgi:transposase-like protein
MEKMPDPTMMQTWGRFDESVWAVFYTQNLAKVLNKFMNMKNIFGKSFDNEAEYFANVYFGRLEKSLYVRMYVCTYVE